MFIYAAGGCLLILYNGVRQKVNEYKNKEEAAAVDRLRRPAVTRSHGSDHGKVYPLGGDRER